MPDIRTEDLRKEFKDIVAVRDISITFSSSSVTCLLGPSGCGKTTLLRIIAGLEKPTRGHIFFGNEKVTHLPPEKRNIGMVFQYPVVYRGLNVYRNIDLPLMEEGLSEVERRKRVDEVVEILGLTDSLDKDIDQLDNSTRQKVAVARAVARKPQIILFDEPLTNVDVDTKVQLKEALKHLTKQLKQTILYVTHDQTEAMTLADQIALMKEGIIVQRDEPRLLYSNPADMFGGWFLGNPGMNFVQVDVEPGPPSVLQSPLFQKPVHFSPPCEERRVTIGIRPENIKISSERTPQASQGNVISKSIVVGGQFLAVIDVAGISLKTKVRPNVGRNLERKVWVQLPLDQITTFKEDGSKLGSKLSW
jgi:ABC-type sugar transport system ATPase subunit